MKSLLLGAAALAALATTSAHAYYYVDATKQPSFNCRYAKAPDEVLICERPDLAELDRTMAALYSDQYNITEADKRRVAIETGNRPGDISWPSKHQMRADQARWLKSRHACGYDFDCIKAAYDQRIAELRECGL
jgi:uncharacterized protein